MPIRDAQTLETANIIFGDKASGNPYSGSLSDGALENFVMDHGKLVRVPFMPTFHTSASSEKVWRTYPFQFTRDGAPEQQLLIFKANGRVYKRTGGMEVEISPSANTITAYAGTAGTASGTLWTNPTNATGAINGTYATYNAVDDRYEAVYAGAGTFNKSAFIEHEFGAAPLNRISVTVQTDSTRGNTGSLWVYVDGVAYTQEIGVVDGEITHVVEFDGETNYTSIWVLVQARTWADDAGAYAYITKIDLCMG